MEALGEINGTALACGKADSFLECLQRKEETNLETVGEANSPIALSTLRRRCAGFWMRIYPQTVSARGALFDAVQVGPNFLQIVSHKRSHWL